MIVKKEKEEADEGQAEMQDGVHAPFLTVGDEDPITMEQNTLQIRFNQDLDRARDLGLDSINEASTLYREVPIWNRARGRFLTALAASVGAGGALARDAQNVAGNTILKATRMARDLLAALTRLDVAERFWGRYSTGYKEAKASSKTLRTIMVKATDALDKTQGRPISPSVLQDMIVELEQVYADLDTVALASMPLMPEGDKIFDPLALVEDVSSDMRQLHAYFRSNLNADGSDFKSLDAYGLPRDFKFLRYWAKDGPTPDYATINNDIARVLRALETKPNPKTQIILGPRTDAGSRFLGLSAQKTAELFGSDEASGWGSIATRSGFAIQRRTRNGRIVNVITQRVREYDLRVVEEPIDDPYYFKVRVGWTLIPSENGWWALSVFLLRYANFLDYVAKLLRFQDATDEYTAVNHKLYVGAISERPSNADNLEVWLHDNYATLGRPTRDSTKVPDGQGRMKMQQPSTTMPSLEAYIGLPVDDNDPMDDWETTEDLPVGATTTAGPPDIGGDTDWSTWE